jgi:hypothetical protein
MVNDHGRRCDTPNAVERKNMRLLTMNQFRHIDIPLLLRRSSVYQVARAFNH